MRPVRWLAGTRKVTELIARSSRILICVDCLLSSGTPLLAMYGFLLALQRTNSEARSAICVETDFLRWKNSLLVYLVFLSI